MSSAKRTAAALRGFLATARLSCYDIFWQMYTATDFSHSFHYSIQKYTAAKAKIKRTFSLQICRQTILRNVSIQLFNL